VIGCGPQICFWFYLNCHDVSVARKSTRIRHQQTVGAFHVYAGILEAVAPVLELGNNRQGERAREACNLKLCWGYVEVSNYRKLRFELAIVVVLNARGSNLRLNHR